MSVHWTDPKPLTPQEEYDRAGDNLIAITLILFGAYIVYHLTWAFWAWNFPV